MDIFLFVSCSNKLLLAVRNDFRLFTKVSFGTRKTYVLQTRRISFKNIYRLRNKIALFHRVEASWYSLIIYSKTKSAWRFYKTKGCGAWREGKVGMEFHCLSLSIQEEKIKNLELDTLSSSSKVSCPTPICMSLHTYCALYLLINWNHT